MKKTAVFMDVTPKMAAEWMATNHNNRNVRANMVEKIRRDLLAGVFRSNGETVKIDESGDIMDGQHRLMACIASGVTMEDVLVVTGIPRSYYLTIDGGLTKKFSDMVGSTGECNSTTIAAASRLIVLWDYDKLAFSGSNLTPSSQEMIAVIEKYQQTRGVVNYIAARRAYGMTTSMACLIGLSAALEGKWDRFELFYDRVRRGESLTKTDPEFSLRSWLAANCGIRSRTAKPGFILAMCIKAWNYAAEEKQSRTLLIRTGEGFPILAHPDRKEKS